MVSDFGIRVIAILSLVVGIFETFIGITLTYGVLTNSFQSNTERSLPLLLPLLYVCLGILKMWSGFGLINKNARAWYLSILVQVTSIYIYGYEYLMPGSKSSLTSIAGAITLSSVIVIYLLKRSVRLLYGVEKNVQEEELKTKYVEIINRLSVH